VSEKSGKGQGWLYLAVVWNGSLKVEAIHGEKFVTREEAKKHVFEYIDVYYNRKRLHSKLGYLSPIAFEEKQVA
jgi:putative transposase